MTEEHSNPHQAAEPFDAASRKKYALSDTFTFECRKGLSCFTHCCRDITIILTPYDVLRMKRGTGLTSEEFLKTYTTALVDEKGFPCVVLKMKDDETKDCPFVSSEGCTIYQDRPWACRMFPLFPAPFTDNQFHLREDPLCEGLRLGREISIQDYLREQQIELHQDMNEAYKDITMHEYLLHKDVKLTAEESKLLYRACYDLDKFKRFLFDSTFFDRFDVAGETVAKVAASDEHLLDFAYKWIRFSIFRDPILRIRQPAAESKSRKNDLG